MSLTDTLKDKWNRIHCRLDGGSWGMFTSQAVDAELKKDGWKLRTEYFTAVVPMAVCGYQYTYVTNPQGEQISTAAQRKEYLAARRDAAERVYGLK